MCHEISNTGHNKNQKDLLGNQMTPVSLSDWAKGHLITHLTAVKFPEYSELSPLIYKNLLCSEYNIYKHSETQILTHANLPRVPGINSTLISGQ